MVLLLGGMLQVFFQQIRSTLREEELIQQVTQGIFELKTATGPKSFGISICFEDAFPEIIRKDVIKGAHFLVNLSSDAWFLDSAELRQHSDIAVFRAVETRRPLIRATNTGISSIIDPTGKQTFLQDESGRITCVKGCLRAPIMLAKEQEQTYYTTYGDVFIFLCALAVAPVLVIALVFRRGEEQTPEID